MGQLVMRQALQVGHRALLDVQAVLPVAKVWVFGVQIETGLRCARRGSSSPSGKVPQHPEPVRMLLETWDQVSSSPRRHVGSPALGLLPADRPL